MDLSAINWLLLLASLMVAATPILLAAVGELVVEKAGVLNLGVEGMMITGAICGFAIAVETGSPSSASSVPPSGRASVVAFRLADPVLLSNQVATGLALTLFGLGLRRSWARAMSGSSRRSRQSSKCRSGDIPIWAGFCSAMTDGLFRIFAGGRGLGRAQVYPAGLILRATGENHDAAHALGYKVDPHPAWRNCLRRRLRRAWRCLSQPGPGAAMDRGDDCRRRLDRAGDRGVRSLEAAAGFAGRLSVWRRDRIAAQSAGRRACDPGRVLVHVALSDNHPGAGYHVVRPIPRGTQRAGCLGGHFHAST